MTPAIWSGILDKQPVDVIRARFPDSHQDPFIYRKLAQVSKDFVPKVEAAYYVHNFKGTKPACLFRQYPGPWQMLKRDSDGSMHVKEEWEERPALRQVALEVLPKL